MAKKKVTQKKTRAKSQKKSKSKSASLVKAQSAIKLTEKAFGKKKLSSALAKLGKNIPQKIKITEERKMSGEQMKASQKRFHGIRLSKFYFPSYFWNSKCKNVFCYLTPTKYRQASRLPFTNSSKNLLTRLGNLMGDPSRDVGPDSNIPAGYTYFGQFVDHDVTLDVSSNLSSSQQATSIENMRTPVLDLDSVYGRGPGLDPFLYDFSSANPTAIKMQLGINRNTGSGGPSSNNGPSGMQIQRDSDVPRVAGTNTAVIGDPRNDENLIVSQLHHTFLKFHNKVVDLLVSNSFSGDIFIEAKQIVTHHYQYVVLHDFLKRICGRTAIRNALRKQKKSRKVCMPVEFSVAAYRFGHSMIRNNYWINFRFPNQSLGEVFQFIRNPRLPVFSNWVVDFNSFFPTGKFVPVNNMARKIDSALANGLESLPGTPPGIMKILATRNLLRGLALGLPSGQAVAKYFRIRPLTSARLLSGLSQAEKDVLNANRGLLLKKTPLWYYILREAKLKKSGNSLGPVGAKIVADTFVKILKSDSDSFLNKPGGFTPSLPTTLASPASFQFADIVKLSGVNLP